MAQPDKTLKTELKATNTKTPLESLSTILSDDMKEVNATILTEMRSEVPLIPQLAGYLIASGGKRVRPLLTLATSRLINADMETSYLLAATVEFIHTATLLHDDVVDGSDERRGQKAANLVFGNQETVLVGDFLFSRAFQLMVRTHSIEILRILSEASAVIAEGEVLQLQYQQDISINWNIYKKIIGAKTASLFAASCEISGAIAQDTRAQAHLKAYGYNLGMAFQITDDTLDYDAKQEEFGKALGDDFREGKITAPVLFALEKANEQEKEFWHRTMVNLDIQDNDFAHAKKLIKNHNALEESKNLARDFVKKAQDALSELKKTSSNTLNEETLSHLETLPEYIISRLL